MLDERRLALEELQARQDYELRSRELDLKSSESGWVTRLFTPLTTTIFAGILTLAASAVGSLIQSRNALDLERQKFEATSQLELRKQQHELILKMVSVGDERQAKANLRFLAESGLIDRSLANRVQELTDVPVLPAPALTGPASSRDFQAVRTDDEALNLILSWEGGYAQNDAYPQLSTNAGISLTALSAYLGRTASLDDLRNLPQHTIRAYYKQKLLPAAGIASPLVRAAFLNVAVLSGVAEATRVFQKATGTEPDGVIGPISIWAINSSVEVLGPESVVETANCLALERLKEKALLPISFEILSRRFRAFSPEKLAGRCPDLLPAEASRR